MLAIENAGMVTSVSPASARVTVRSGRFSANGGVMEDEKPQIDKFKDAARELECDDDEQRFKERLGKLVKAKPTEPKP